MSTETERWLPVAGFRGYEVSNLGRVRSYLTSLGPRAPLRRTPHLRLLKRDSQGRECVELAGPFGGVRRLVSVLVADAFGSEPESAPSTPAQARTRAGSKEQR